MAHRARVCCSALALCLALAACSRGGEAPSSPDAAASAVLAKDATLAAELDHAERFSRAKPAQLQEQLHARQTGARNADQLSILALRALLAALARDRAVSEDLTQQLRDWPAGELRASAQLAALSASAEYLRQHGDLREARKQLVGAEPVVLAAAGPLYRWRYYRQLAGISGDSGELNASLANAHTALRLAEQLEQSWRIALSLVDLAHISDRADTPARARQLIGQALSEAQKDPDPMTLNQVYTMRGILYADDSDSSITLQAWSDALDQAALAGADAVRALGLANLADYHLRQGHPSRALQLAEEALPLARATRHTNAESVARSNIGLAKIALGRIAEGREDVRAGLMLDEQQGALSYAADGWKELASYLERAGDLEGAVSAYRDYRAMIDRVLRDDTRKALLEAQERQDAEQRAREIELLNRDNTLKAEQLHQRNLALALWSALGGCILVTLALLGQAWRRVRRTNEALAHSNASLKRQSETDALTGLANRRHFQAVMKMLNGPEGLKASMFLIDVDHFKRINDSFGHSAGDVVLVEVARRLREAVRDDDLIVRWGGEEFLIVARTSSPEDAAHLAQRLLDLIGGSPVAYDGRDIIVTASIGFASLPLAPHGLKLDWERAIDLVDTVMYLAKGHGRNKAYGIDHLAATDEAQAAALMARLEAACAEGQVMLVALTGPPVNRSLESGFYPLDGLGRQEAS